MFILPLTRKYYVVVAMLTPKINLPSLSVLACCVTWIAGQISLGSSNVTTYDKSEAIYCRRSNCPVIHLYISKLFIHVCLRNYDFFETIYRPRHKCTYSCVCRISIHIFLFVRILYIQRFCHKIDDNRWQSSDAWKLALRPIFYRPFVLQRDNET